MSKQDDLIWLTQVNNYHRVDDWMGDYDPSEVGEYLVDKGFNINISGRITWLEASTCYYPTRGGFILWRYQKSAPPVQSKAEDVGAE